MSWAETKQKDDVIDHTDWNDHVTETLRISSQSQNTSGAFWAHSSNSDIHYPSSQLTGWLDSVYAPSGDLSWSELNDVGNVNVSSPQSGQLLTFLNNKWENKNPPITFNTADVSVSAQQSIKLARFTTPSSKKVYVWQAAACNSGGASVNNLKIQLLSGTSVIYTTSSATVQEGYPLASSKGNIEIRFTYSGTGVTGVQNGTAFMNLSIL